MSDLFLVAELLSIVLSARINLVINRLRMRLTTRLCNRQNVERLDRSLDYLSFAYEATSDTVKLRLNDPRGQISIINQTSPEARSIRNLFRPSHCCGGNSEIKHVINFAIEWLMQQHPTSFDEIMSRGSFWWSERWWHSIRHTFLLHAPIRLNISSSMGFTWLSHMSSEMYVPGFWSKECASRLHALECLIAKQEHTHWKQFN